MRVESHRKGHGRQLTEIGNMIQMAPHREHLQEEPVSFFCANLDGTGLALDLDGARRPP